MAYVRYSNEFHTQRLIGYGSRSHIKFYIGMHVAGYALRFAVPTPPHEPLDVSVCFALTVVEGE